jgi:hypothetical protein
MKRVIRATSLAVATFAVMLACAATAFGAPGDGGGCATTCSVGGAGTGGQNSDGRAGGFRLEGPSTGFPGSTFTNQGNEMAGHIAVDGASTGSASGAFTPQGVLVGHFDGVSAGFFGTDDPCSGVCG